MRKRGSDKYPEDMRQEAIRLIESGETTLCGAAKKTGIPKTTIKYWVDNANKFGWEGNGEGPLTKALFFKRKVYEFGWGMVYRLIKAGYDELQNGSGLEKIQAAINLIKGLSMVQIPGMATNGKVHQHVDPNPDLNVTEDYDKRVDDFMSQQQDEEKGGEEEEGSKETNLATLTEEQRPCSNKEDQDPIPQINPEPANGATC